MILRLCRIKYLLVKVRTLKRILLLITLSYRVYEKGRSERLWDLLESRNLLVSCASVLILWVSCVIVTRHDVREAAWSVLPLCHLFLPKVICRLVKVGFFLFQQKLEEGDDVICVFLQRSGIAVGITQADLRSLLCQVSFDHRLTTFSWLPSCE